MQIFEVNFYKKQDETCPLTQFLDSLEPKMRAKVLRSILLLEQNGNNIIITHGFIKKTQKTPRSEISLAKKYRKDYLSRKEYSHE